MTSSVLWKQIWWSFPAILTWVFLSELISTIVLWSCWRGTVSLIWVSKSSMADLIMTSKEQWRKWSINTYLGWKFLQNSNFTLSFCITDFFTKEPALIFFDVLKHSSTSWLVKKNISPRRILCQLILWYERKKSSKSRCPPTIDWFFLWFEMPTLHLNCQRQQDPLTSSSQVIAMQMSSSRDKLAAARQWPCPLVCLTANQVMYLKKSFPVINAERAKYPEDLHGKRLHLSLEKSSVPPHLSQHFSPLKMRSKFLLA